MQEKNISKISTIVMSFFKKTAGKIDLAVKFVKRKSKLGAQLFSEVLITGCLLDPTISLERLCKLLKEKGVNITKQGLHQRFNREATLLMKNLFEESLNQFRTEKVEVLDLFKPFSSIKMLDSSGVELPTNLKDIFRGYGGGASEAGLKIQLLYDYMQGQVSDMTITEARKNDQSFDGHMNQIEKGALYLQDLGYFKLKFFETVKNKEAYFVSRYSYPTKMLDENEEPLDLIKELGTTDTLYTKKLWLGKKEKIKVRLIAFRLPDNEVEKRIRKLKEKSKKRGKTPAKETLELTKWSIYITNVSENMLSNEQVYLVYSLRWQIELFFKLCKSEAGIDKINGRKLDRVLCELYAKLICVVTLLYLCFPIRWQEKQEISFYKAYIAFKLKATDFFKALKSTYRLTEFLKMFLSDLKYFTLKDKYRKKRKLTYQKIMDATSQEVLRKISPKKLIATVSEKESFFSIFTPISWAA